MELRQERHKQDVSLLMELASLIDATFYKRDLAQKWRRFSSVLKSRNPKFTGFFTLKTKGDAMNTHEMWVWIERTSGGPCGYDAGEPRKAISSSRTSIGRVLPIGR